MTINYIFTLRLLLTNKKGQGLVEYVFIISFIALALVLALGTLQLKLTEFFTSVAQIFSNIK